MKHACTLLGASQIQQIFIYLSETRFALMTAVAIGFGRAIGEVDDCSLASVKFHELPYAQNAR